MGGAGLRWEYGQGYTCMGCSIRASSAWPTRIAWSVLFLHLFLSPLVFCKATFEVFEFSKVALLTLTALVLLAVTAPAWTARLWSLVQRPGCSEPICGCRRLSSDPLTWGFVLLVGSASISTWHSLSPRTSFWGTPESDAGLYVVLAYAVLFFATRALCQTVPVPSWLLIAAVAAGAGATLYAVAQMVHADPIQWTDYSTLGSYARPFGTLGHANLLGAYLVMVWPVTVYLAREALERRAWVTGLGLASLAVGMLVVVVASLSRGAWLAFVCMAACLLLSWNWKTRRRSAVCWLVLGLAGIGLAVLGCQLLPGGPDLWTPLAERVTHFTDSPRYHIWRAGWDIFRDHPVLGCGLDTFQLAFAGKCTPAYWQVEWGATPYKAHNELIHVLATQGLLGGLAVGLIVWGTIRTGWRAWGQADGDSRRLLAVLFAGLVAFVVQALFSFTVVATGSLAVTLVALLDGLKRRRAVQSGGVQPALPAAVRWTVQVAALAGAAVLTGILVVNPFRANLAYTQSRLLTTHPFQALEEAERAVAGAPGQALYWSQLGTVARACSAISSPSDQHRYLLRARVAWQKARALVPADSYHHANLGCLLADMAREQLASSTEVFAEFDRALQLAPGNAYFAIEAADGALALGDLPRAEAYAGNCAALYPDFGAAQARLGYVAYARQQWTQACQRLKKALALPWHDDEAGRDRGQVILALVLCHLGELSEALKQASGPAPGSAEWISARFIRAQILERLGDLTQAAADYQCVLAADPGNVQAVHALQRLSATRRR